MTSAPSDSAHSAAAAQLSSSTGVSLALFSVLARMKSAAKAGPTSWPSWSPPSTDSVMVPWLPSPWSAPSPTSSSPLTKSWAATRCSDEKTSWLRSLKPPSKTATTTPSPWNPIWWTAGTPIWASCPTDVP